MNSNITGCKLSSCIFLFIRLSGNNEADGNERLDTLGVLVLQVFRFRNHYRSSYDDRFTLETRRWSGDLYVRRMVCHICVSAALWAFRDDFMLRHHYIFFNRYDYMMRRPIVSCNKDITHQAHGEGVPKLCQCQLSCLTTIPIIVVPLELLPLSLEQWRCENSWRDRPLITGKIHAHGCLSRCLIHNGI